MLSIIVIKYQDIDEEWITIKEQVDLDCAIEEYKENNLSALKVLV